MKIEAGKTYDVNHSRKGKFKLKVTAVNGEWVEGTIVTGKAKMISRSNNDVEAGESLTVRDSLATWTEVQS
jgi:hypothetical protein